MSKWNLCRKEIVFLATYKHAQRTYKHAQRTQATTHVDRQQEQTLFFAACHGITYYLFARTQQTCEANKDKEKPSSLQGESFKSADFGYMAVGQNP